MNDAIKEIQVVILAGGLGTRIQSVAGALPKSLIPVSGRPFVDWQLDLLRRNKLTNILFLVGYKGGQIRSYISDGTSRGMKVTYVQEPPDNLLGTGGALVHALPHLADTFILLYGDSYLPVDYQAIIKWYTRQTCPALMSVFKNDGQWDHSNVRVDGDRVAFYSKTAAMGEADHIDYGLSIFRRDIINTYARHSLPMDLAVIQEDLVARHELAAYRVDQRFYEIGKPEGLADLEVYLKSESKHE